MSFPELRPVYYEPEDDVGFFAERRADGGLQVTFYWVDERTLEAWRRFAQQHQINSDRFNRNLYDLRSLHTLPEEAIRYAVEVNSDPASRNVRVAVVVSSEAVLEAVERIRALTPGGRGAEIRVFTNMLEAELWLADPLETMA